MNRYTLYCTEEQTKRAFELGAKLTEHPFEASIIKANENMFQNIVNINERYYYIPTAEQMRGWLMDKLKATTFANKHYSCGVKEGFGFLIIGAECILECDSSDNGKWLLNSDKEATLASIDAALYHLINNKK